MLGMVWFMIRMVFSWDVFLNCVTIKPLIIGKIRQNQRRNIDTQYISPSMKIIAHNLKEDRKFDSFVLHKEYPKSVHCNRTVHRGKPDFWVCCGARALVDIGKSHHAFPYILLFSTSQKSGGEMVIALTTSQEKEKNPLAQWRDG